MYGNFKIKENLMNIPESIIRDGIQLYKFRVKDGNKTEFKYLPEDECRKIARERNVMRDAFPEWLDITAMRHKPSNLAKLTKYTGTAVKEGDINCFDFTINDISKSGIGIKSNQKLNEGDKLDLDFILDKKYSLSGVVKRKGVNAYGIEFIKPEENDRFSSLANNYKKLVSLITSKTTN